MICHSEVAMPSGKPCIIVCAIVIGEHLKLVTETIKLIRTLFTKVMIQMTTFSHKLV